MTPTLSDLLATARVVSLPLTGRFRGIDHREVVLFEAENGWTEFSPFLEYSDAECAAWLAAAIDFGWGPDRPALRTIIRVNATLPAVAPEHVASVLARYPGARTVKVKVAAPLWPSLWETSLMDRFGSEVFVRTKLTLVAPAALATIL